MGLLSQGISNEVLSFISNEDMANYYAKNSEGVFAGLHFISDVEYEIRMDSYSLPSTATYVVYGSDSASNYANQGTVIISFPSHHHCVNIEFSSSPCHHHRIIIASSSLHHIIIASR